MGTDISMFAEVVETDATGNKSWRFVDEEIFKNPYSMNGVREYTNSVFSHRSYMIFAALADIRSKDYEELYPLFAQRGLPDDTTSAMIEELNADFHYCHSYFTLAEIEAFINDGTFKMFEEAIEYGSGRFDILIDAMKEVREKFVNESRDASQVRMVFAFC